MLQPDITCKTAMNTISFLLIAQDFSEISDLMDRFTASIELDYPEKQQCYYEVDANSLVLRTHVNLAAVYRTAQLVRRHMLTLDEEET